MKKLMWVLLLLSLTVTGCATDIPMPPSPTIIPTMPPTETHTPHITARATLTATLTPTLPTLPTETATTTPVDAGVLTPLAPLPATVTQVKMGFGERWFTYLRLDEQPLPRSLAATLFVLDSQSATSWEVTSACLDTLCEFVWTSTGQLVWLEEGAVFLADADGQNKRNLNAPAEIIEIFGISPTDVAILRGSNGTDLWRLYLPDGRFDAIPDPQRNRNPIPDFVSQNDLLYFTEDNTIVGLAYDITPRTFDGDIQILAIPLQAGSTPTLLAALPRLGYGGRSGPPPLPPVLLAGTSYWVTTESAVLEDSNGAFTSYIVDVERQSVEPVTTIIGVDERYRGWAIVSPDRKWLVTTLYPDHTDPLSATLERKTYIAPASNLREGRLLSEKIYIEGWQQNPPAIFTYYREDKIDAFYWISLETNRKKLLFPVIATYRYPTILSATNIIFVQPSQLLPVLLAVSPEGNITSMTTLQGHIFPFDDQTTRRWVYPVYATERCAYYVAGAPNLPEPDEQAYLWRWDISE
jgi:hypothetical protein